MKTLKTKKNKHNHLSPHPTPSLIFHVMKYELGSFIIYKELVTP